MTDQQDLRARLLAEADQWDSWEFDHPDDYPITTVALLREAAAQLGRVGEPEVPSPSNWLTGILAKVPTMVLTDSMIRGIEFEAYRAMENDQHRAAAKERLISQQKAPEVNSTPQPDSQKSCGGECHHDWRGDGLCDKCGATYATDSAAPGGDVERLREALENLISVAEPMVAEDGKCPPIREPNERGGTTVTIDPFPLLKYRVEDMDDLREGIKSARAIIAALSAPKQVGETDTLGFDFYQHLHRQRDWSKRTFGPGARTAGVIDHIRKELREIEANPNDLCEWIDVAILALDGAWRSGASPLQIIETLIGKQTKNEGRTWPDWRTADQNKAIEHDRSSDSGLEVQGER